MSSMCPALKPRADRDVGPSGDFEELGHDGGAVMGVTRGRGDEKGGAARGSGARRRAPRYRRCPSQCRYRG